MITIILSVILIVISLVALLYPVIIRYSERPKLHLSLRNITFRDDKIGKKDEMVQILMSNDGYRAIIISRVYYRCNGKGYGDCGSYDELTHPYGIADIVLPAIVKPGEVFEFNFLRKGALKNISEISVIDSKNKAFQIPQKEIDCFNNTGSSLCVLMSIKHQMNQNILKKVKNFFK